MNLFCKIQCSHKDCGCLCPEDMTNKICFACGGLGNEICSGIIFKIIHEMKNACSRESPGRPVWLGQGTAFLTLFMGGQHRCTGAMETRALYF